MPLRALHRLRAGGGRVSREQVQLDGGAAIPGLVVAAQGRPQKAYRAWYRHAVACPVCLRESDGCDVSAGLWAAYESERR